MYGFNKGVPIGLIYMAYGFISQLYIHFTDEEAEDARGCMICL